MASDWTPTNADDGGLTVTPAGATVTGEPVAAGGTDEIASPARRKRSALATSLLAAGVTMALLLGVGGYVAYRKYFADSRSPALFTPASVAIFLSIELDASLEQELNLARLAKKIDQASSGTGDQWRAEDILTRLLESLELRGVDVKRDLTSWLGHRFAISLWVGEQSRPYALISATSKDNAKAKAGLDRVRSTQSGADLGYVLGDGGVLIAVGDRDAQQAADAAAAEATRSPLERLQSYQNARQWLDEPQVVTLWIDSKRYVEAISAVADAPPATLDADHVVSVLGIRATDNGIEARYRSFGSKHTNVRTTDALARISDLPADTQIGAVVSIPEGLSSDPGSPSGLTAGGSFGLQAILFGLVTGFAGTIPTPDSPVPPVGPTPAPSGAYTEAQQKEIDALLAKDPATLTDAESARLKELIGYSPRDFPTSEPTFPGDFDPLSALSGATLLIAVTRLATSPGVRVVAEAASAQSAADLAKLVDPAPEGVTVSIAGSTVTVTSSDYVAGSGRLADVAAFKQVMAGAPDRTTAAVYVDLQAIADGGNPIASFKLRTVGMVQGFDGDDEVGLLRLILG